MNFVAKLLAFLVISALHASLCVIYWPLSAALKGLETLTELLTDEDL